MHCPRLCSNGLLHHLNMCSSSQDTRKIDYWRPFWIHANYIWMNTFFAWYQHTKIPLYANVHAFFNNRGSLWHIPPTTSNKRWKWKSCGRHFEMAAILKICKIQDGSISYIFRHVPKYICANFHACTQMCTIWPKIVT